ncbi:hypothetical protein S245_001755 [Arachis hypogaea]
MNGRTGLSSCVGSSDGARSTVVRLLCFLPRGVVSLPCPNLSSLESPCGIAGGVPRHARSPTSLGALCGNGGLHDSVSRKDACRRVRPKLPLAGASAARRAGYSLFDGTYYSDNRSNSRANTCNKPRLLEGMHLLDKRSTQALPVALMIHDNSSDRTALVPATHHSNFCPINFRCWTLGWADRSAVGVHRSARPFCQRCAPGLNWPGRFSSAVTLKKLECSKQAYALYTLAWDNIIGFRSYCVGLRDRTFAKDVFINQERKLGARRRSDTVLVSTINDADQGSADVAFRTPLAPYEKSKSFGSGGSMVARLKLKGIDRRAPPGVEPAA